MVSTSRTEIIKRKTCPNSQAAWLRIQKLSKVAEYLAAYQAKFLGLSKRVSLSAALSVTSATKILMSSLSLTKRPTKKTNSKKSGTAVNTQMTQAKSLPKLSSCWQPRVVRRACLTTQVAFQFHCPKTTASTEIAGHILVVSREVVWELNFI